MNPSPLRTNESMLPKRAHPGERILLLPMLFCFLIGFCTSILYCTMVGLDSISLGAIAGLFIFPPVLGYHTFATPTDSPLAKHIAFFTIVFAELACCASLYFHWKSIPIPKFSTSNFLYWPFVRTTTMDMSEMRYGSQTNVSWPESLIPYWRFICTQESNKASVSSLETISFELFRKIRT